MTVCSFPSMFVYQAVQPLPFTEAFSGTFVFHQHPKSPPAVYNVTTLRGSQLRFLGENNVIKNLNKTSTLTIPIICNFVLPPPSMALKQFRLPTSIHQVWVNSLYPFQALSDTGRYHQGNLPVNLIIVRFEPRIYSRKLNVLTTRLHAYEGNDLRKSTKLSREIGYQTSSRRKYRRNLKTKNEIQ